MDNHTFKLSWLNVTVSIFDKVFEFTMCGINLQKQ